jgi:antitoxin PrlF
MTIATITSKGQVTLPKEIRSRLHLKAGEKIDFRVDEETGTTTLVPLNKRVDDVFGLLHRKETDHPHGGNG